MKKRNILSILWILPFIISGSALLVTYMLHPLDTTTTKLYGALLVVTIQLAIIGFFTQSKKITAIQKKKR